MSEATCRSCLIQNVPMHSIRNTEFQEVYEKLANTKLVIADCRPERVCQPCYSLLRRCHGFSVMSQKADYLLTQLYRDGIEISSDAITALQKTISPEAVESARETEDVPLLKDLIHNELVKDELNPVKVEVVAFEEYYDNEDVKIEDTSENNENDNGKCIPQLVGVLKKPETCIKETKNTINLNNSYTCDSCDKTFSLKSILESHLKTHIKKLSSVTRCDDFRDKCRMKKLMKSQDGRSNCYGQLDKACSADTDDLENVLTEEKSCSFNIDYNATKLSQNSSTHIMRTHTDKKSYSCDLCDKKFKHNNNLQKHIKVHNGEKLCACDRCGKTFPNGYQLKRHMRCHTGEKPYTCDICHKTCSDRSNLKKHIMTHFSKKPFFCTECNASFTQKGNLQRHMRSHTGEMPFFCDICQKPYPDASLLKRHIRIHTGEKPFICDVCGKAFSDKDNFKTHMRLHTGEKPYICKICDYKSAHGNCLKLHLAKKHNLDT